MIFVKLYLPGRWGLLLKCKKTRNRFVIKHSLEAHVKIKSWTGQQLLYQIRYWRMTGAAGAESAGAASHEVVVEGGGGGGDSKKETLGETALEVLRALVQPGSGGGVARERLAGKCKCVCACPKVFVGRKCGETGNRQGFGTTGLRRCGEVAAP